MSKAWVFILFLLIGGFSPGTLPAATTNLGFENDLFRLRLTPRTPNQIAAFYTGRGFPPFAIDEVRTWCFITLGMRNKSQDLVWLDLSNWRFTTSEGELTRYLRPALKQRWQELGLEKRFQSTFRWTLMPEKLDFHPYEGEGGNIILPRTDKPITVTATIAAGEDKSKVFAIQIDNVRCAVDTSSGAANK